MTEEVEREKKNKYDVLHPPLEDTSTYKDVKKYTNERVNARVKNAANKKGTSKDGERKFRKKKYVRKIPRFITKKSFGTR